MINIEVEDIKVIGANAICMIALQIQQINVELQTILFLATIGYTLVRTINEVQKFFKDREK